MRSAKLLVPLALALLCSLAFAGDKEGKGDKGKGEGKGEGKAVGVLAAPPAGADAKVVAVITTKMRKEGVKEEKTINLMAATEDIAAQLKELAKKGARVKLSGEPNADGTAITVSKVAEVTEGEAGIGKGKGEGKGEGKRKAKGEAKPE